MKLAGLLVGASIFAACLDFEGFQVATTSSSSSSTGGGGNSQGGGGTGAGSAGGGQSGVGGDGGVGGVSEGGGGAIPEVGPCFVGAELQDDFDGGAQLAWVTDDVAFTSNEARLSFANANAASLALTGSPGVLDECYFRVEVTKADDGIVYVQWLSPSNEAFTLGFNEGQPFADLTPASSLPLADTSSFTAGFVRIGESSGTYFLQTAADSDGPWTTRYSTSSPPAWIQGQGHLVLGAYTYQPTGTYDARFDSLNVP